MAEAYGIEERPSLVVFEKGIPNVYEGDLFDSDLGNLNNNSAFSCTVKMQNIAITYRGNKK